MMLDPEYYDGPGIRGRKWVWPDKWKMEEGRWVRTSPKESHACDEVSVLILPRPPR